MKWVSYILELGRATGGSRESHRNFWSNEIRPLGLSVNSGSPELPVPWPELPVHTGTSGRNPEQFSRTRARAQNYTNRNFRCLTGTSCEYRNFQTETGTVFSNAGACGRQRPELPVGHTGTSGARLSSLLSTTQIKINGVKALESKRLLSIKILSAIIHQIFFFNSINELTPVDYTW
jgi:hypothetical protein